MLESTSVAFSDDSRSLIVLGLEGEVRWHDSQSGQRIGEKVLTEKEVVRSVLSADGTLAAQIFADGSMSVWNLVADEQLWRREIVAPLAYANKVVGFSPDGRVVATACLTDATYRIHVYNTDSGACLGHSPRFEATFKGLLIAANHVVYFWDTTGVIRAWKVGWDREQGRFAWPIETSRPSSKTQ